MSVYGNNIEFSGIEALNELRVYADDNLKLYIGIHPGEARNFDTDPYFKISWDRNFNNNKVARISMRTGTYVVHNKKTAIVPNYIIKEVNKKLALPYAKCSVPGYTYDSVDEKTRMTIWRGMINEISKLYSIPFDELDKRFPRIILGDLGPIRGNNITIIQWGSK